MTEERNAEIRAAISMRNKARDEMHKRVADSYPRYYKRKNFHDVLSRWFPMFRLERSIPPPRFFVTTLGTIRREYERIRRRIEAQAASANPSGKELGQLEAQLTMLRGSVEGILPGQTEATVGATYGGVNVDRLHAAQTNYVRAIQLAEDALFAIVRNAGQESIEKDDPTGPTVLLAEAEKIWAQGDIELTNWRPDGPSL